jgi:hypothetical protein
VDLADINDEILLSYACERDEFSYTTMLNYFVPKKCAKETLLKHKKSLEVDGKLKKKLSSFTGRPVYYVPNEIRKKMEAKNMFDKIVESAKGEELENLVTALQKENERLRYREKFHYLQLIGLRKTLKQIIENRSYDSYFTPKLFVDYLDKRKDETTTFLETLVDAWRKGWINDEERYSWAHTYEGFIEDLAKFKRIIAEEKFNWHLMKISDAQIKIMKDRAHALSKEIKCIHCNGLIPKETLYCPNCGELRIDPTQNFDEKE